ncbi:hypothetical protein QZH41_001976 [Actinostola sp. cb2023]|nr:hypothetical protein QZH41_001976 [Actinostola sp. cb2023]
MGRKILLLILIVVAASAREYEEEFEVNPEELDEEKEAYNKREVSVLSVPGQCGVSSVSRVIAGVDAKPGAWPWQIGLHRSGRFICGGALIKKDWIVTAAHCVSQSNPALYTIRLGDHNRNVNEGTEQDIKAIRVISHPSYNNPRLSSDIALIQLQRPATLNSRVGLVCLPDQDYVVPSGSNCYITGWGKIKHPGGSHHTLQQAHMPAVSLAECKKKNDPTGITVLDTMICGTKPGSQISGCHGDSGGPYVCKNSVGRWVLQGDVSWGDPTCNVNKRYTVFGRVAKFRNWIDMHTAGGTMPPTTQPPTVAPGDMTTNFDNGFGNWQQSKSDKFDWTRRSGGTASSNTGPSGGQGGSGSYVYIETSNPRQSGDNAKLTFKGSYSGDMCMTFYYHMYGQTINQLNIYNNNKKIFEKRGKQGNAWHKASVSLKGNRDVVIEAVRGSSYTGDIAIDSITVTKGSCNSPTAPPSPPPPQTPPPPTKPPQTPPPPTKPPQTPPPPTKPPQTPPPPTQTPQTPPPPTQPPVPGQCGVSSVSRVIAGVDAKPGAWPWQIGLHRNGRFICGGSLIKKDWIVTAAHCVTQSNPALYTIRLGDHNRNVNEGTEQDIKAIRVISHPNYNNPRLSNDIALIQLQRPATLNNRVGLACLPDQDYVLPAGSNCYITGWGKIKHPGSSHHILQQAHMPSVSLADCKKKNGNIGIPITDAMVCGAKPGTQISGCHGDSGGPYVCKNSVGRWVLQGDVSWGSGSCNVNQLYSVFGRVAKFRNWIDMHTAGGTMPPTTQPPTVAPGDMTTNFDNGFGNWQQSKSDKFDWTRKMGSTSSSNTGPSGGQGGSGSYVYIETSSPRQSGDNAKLTFKGSYSGDMCMTFYYHMYGQTINQLNIYNNNKKIFEKRGKQGNAWHKASVNLKGDRDVVIEGVAGSSYTGDIAIDSITVTKGSCHSPTALPKPPSPPPPQTPPLPTKPPQTPPPPTQTPQTPPPSTQPPVPGQCGVSSVSRVIAGVDAKPGAWPWQIGLHRSGRFICGGSLIKKDWIVTAAHCVTQSNPALYTIRLGDHNRNVDEGTEQDIKAIRVISHPSYNNPRLSNDIALIQLQRPATLNNRVGLACLPDQDYVLPAGSNCYITGWGKIKHPGSSHHILQQAHMPSVSLADCKKKNGNIGIPVTDAMVCGAKPGTQISGCHGDSGGPYVCKNSAGRWVLQGDVSWGSGSCNINQLYTVFGRVAKFRNWIDMHTAGGTMPPTTQPPTVAPGDMTTNFDNGFGNLQQSKSDKFDWTLKSGGKYVYIETSSPRQSGDNAKLTFKGSYSGDMCMTFYYHMYGQTINQLNIYNNNKKIFEKRGNQGNAWHKASVSLKGDSDVVIEGVAGSSYTGDIAIDSITVTKGSCHSPTGPPTPPTPQTPSPPPQTSPPTTQPTNPPCPTAPPPPPTQPPQTPPPPTQPPQTPPPPTQPPVPGQCGVSSVSRVIAGVDAKPGAWPWQIGLHRSGRFICGGALIKKDWIVTAAHCVTQSNPALYTIRLGDHNRNVNEGTEQDIKAIRVISHPSYNNPRLSSDIALIQLQRPATLNSRVGLVCLPGQDYVVPSGSNCYITGWGKIKHPGGSHHTLQQAHMPAVSLAECKKKNDPTGITVLDTMICGTKPGSQISGCHGDSGGPYVCKNAAGRWVLQGDVSWGDPTCNVNKRYTVFGRVAKFRNWIDMHTAGGPTNPPTPPPPQTPPPPTQPRQTASPATQSPGVCGKRPPMSRIVGGTQAKVHGWPWQAMLTTTSGSQFCGGSLVHPQYVVTASHCVQRKSPSQVVIKLGAHYRVTGSTGKEQNIPVAQIFVHPSYHKPMRYSNDIAVLKLARPAVLNKAVSTVCLPDDKFPLPYDDLNKKCYITGWGTLASGGSQPNNLMQASVPLVSKSRCLKGYPGLIHDSMLCAGLDKGGVDACQGDSGGPLV